MAKLNGFSVALSPKLSSVVAKLTTAVRSPTTVGSNRIMTVVVLLGASVTPGCDTTTKSEVPVPRIAALPSVMARLPEFVMMNVRASCGTSGISRMPIYPK